MLLSTLLTLATLGAQPVHAATDAQQAVDAVIAMHNQILQEKPGFMNYNGGILPAIPLARAMYNVHNAVKAVRATLPEGLLEGRELANYESAYLAMCQDFTNAIQECMHKTTVIKQAGLGYIAQGMFMNLINENTALTRDVQSRMTQEDWERFQPCVQGAQELYDQVTAEFAT